jgi:hypothetical protein
MDTGPRKTSIAKGVAIGLAVGVVIGLLWMLVWHLAQDEAQPCDDAARSGAEVIDTLISVMEVSSEARELGAGDDLKRAQLQSRIAELSVMSNQQLEEWGKAKQQCPVTEDSHGL